MKSVTDSTLDDGSPAEPHYNSRAGAIHLQGYVFGNALKANGCCEAYRKRAMMLHDAGSGRLLGSKYVGLPARGRFHGMRVSQMVEGVGSIGSVPELLYQMLALRAFDFIEDEEQIWLQEKESPPM